MSNLTEGDTAPAISLPRDGGGMVDLADLSGPVVVYFYPRDDTPGCTKEAIGFTDDLAAFSASGATVLGISKDTVAKHEKFIAKHDLKIPLLSDADGDVCERYGVWCEKKMYGKVFMGIERATFLIQNGKIAKVWRKVKVPGHVQDVLDTVQAL
ncbi:MAG: thioredoxin-dependent thiol peroxidase [Octadecabacter sp.]